MNFLLETEETIAPGLGFSPFGPCHLLWLTVFLLFTVLCCAVYRRLDVTGRRKMRLLLAAAVVADELLKMAVLLIGGNYMARYLPLHLCSVNIFLIAWHALRPNRTLENFLYTVCMPGAIFPLLTPTWHALPPTSLMHIHSFTVHILLASYPIILLVGRDIRPNPRYLPKCLGLLGGLALIAYGANLIFDTNFMFLMEAPTGTPLMWFEEVCGNHLVGFPVIIAALLLVMYFPALVRSLKTRAAAGK